MLSGRKSVFHWFAESFGAGYGIKMKSILRSDIVQSILAQIIWVYMLAISKTGRWQVEGLERAREIWKDERGGVLACWHSRILLLPVGWTKYVRHFDNDKREGFFRNHRVLTALIYLNENWSSDDGGQLRCYREFEDDEPMCDVLPRAGTIALTIYIL